jgi:hypothetical protein
MSITEDIGIVVLGSSVDDNRRDVVDHYGDMPTETHPRSGCVVATCDLDVDQYKHINKTYPRQVELRRSHDSFESTSPIPPG